MLVTQEGAAGLEDLFVPDREIVTYKDDDHAVRVIRDLLKDEGRREAIADAGRRACLSRHTWEHRGRAVMDVVSRTPDRRLAPARDWSESERLVRRASVLVHFPMIDALRTLIAESSAPRWAKTRAIGHLARGVAKGVSHLGWRRFWTGRGARFPFRQPLDTEPTIMTVAGLVVTLIAVGTLAFGAVYPWAYVPLFAAAALIGAVGLGRHGARPEVRPLAIALLVVWVAVAVQLMPMPRRLLDILSPQAVRILSAFSLTFAGGAPTDWQPLSVDPSDTQTALLALGALSLYLIGLSGSLGRHQLRRVPRALALFAVPLALFGILSREYKMNGRIYWLWQPEQGGGISSGRL